MRWSWIWILGIAISSCSEEMSVQKVGTDLQERGTDGGVDAPIQVVDWDLRQDLEFVARRDLARSTDAAADFGFGPDKGAKDTQSIDKYNTNPKLFDMLQPDLQPFYRPLTRHIMPTGGVFGSLPDEPGRTSEEIPQISIYLPWAYEIGIHEVTQGEWLFIMGAAPSGATYTCLKCPAVWIDYELARTYCNKLSAYMGLDPWYLPDRTITPAPGEPGFHGYRVPYEGEWEIAYRTHTTTNTYAGNIVDPIEDPIAKTIGWYHVLHRSGIYVQQDLQPWGKKQPNIWGLYDMAGNAWEVVRPIYGTRVCRGGSVGTPAGRLRAAARKYVCPAASDTGFRIARYPEP
jgi:hypothetical protein